jgi:hypothetical protein
MRQANVQKRPISSRLQNGLTTARNLKHHKLTVVESQWEITHSFPGP